MMISLSDLENFSADDQNQVLVLPKEGDNPLGFDLEIDHEQADSFW